MHQQLRLELDYPVLIQGERPQRELLRLFVDRAPSVLFATASFAQSLMQMLSSGLGLVAGLVSMVFGSCAGGGCGG